MKKTHGSHLSLLTQEREFKKNKKERKMRIERKRGRLRNKNQEKMSAQAPKHRIHERESRGMEFGRDESFWREKNKEKGKRGVGGMIFI